MIFKTSSKNFIIANIADNTPITEEFLEKEKYVVFDCGFELFEI